MLYLQKEEEARISEALDRRRIINVAIAEPPTVPSLPSNQRYLTVLMGGVFAIFMSIGMAFVAEQVDPTFRTPDEVRTFLDIPVFASLPKNGNHGHNGANPNPQRTTSTETYVS
jgi:capsular polysaccharide biosynthesis protein